MNCPNVGCNRLMVRWESTLPVTTWGCRRCESTVIIPSPADQAATIRKHVARAKRLAKSDWLLRAAFKAWVSGDAFWDGKGYRLKSDRRRRAEWSNAAIDYYPNMSDFHEMASAVAGVKP